MSSIDTLGIKIGLSQTARNARTKEELMMSGEDGKRDGNMMATLMILCTYKRDQNCLKRVGMGGGISQILRFQNL